MLAALSKCSPCGAILYIGEGRGGVLLVAFLGLETDVSISIPINRLYSSRLLLAPIHISKISAVLCSFFLLKVSILTAICMKLISEEQSICPRHRTKYTTTQQSIYVQDSKPHFSSLFFLRCASYCYADKKTKT